LKSEEYLCGHMRTKDKKSLQSQTERKQQHNEKSINLS